MIERARPAVVVTGASGLVGRAVADRLRTAGSVVTALVRGKAGHGLRIDLADRASVDDLLSRAGRPRAVVHLAAAVPSPHGAADTAQTADKTRAIDGVVREFADRAGALLVYASGCSLYDNRTPNWKTEDSPTAAAGHYLDAKLDGERRAAEQGGAILRLSGPVGSYMPPHTVLPRFLLQARNYRTIQVWGDGGREQDFVHVDDIAEAFLRVVESRATGTFNIAAGRPTSMLELAGLCAAAVGPDVVVTRGPPDPQEGRTARYDISKAQALLGWTPSRGLAEALAQVARSQS